jgi:nucleotide-binding universal stress UspA family protein
MTSGDVLTDMPVVVGTDGSPHADAAVRFAAAEADLRHRPLVVMHAIPWPTAGRRSGDDVADLVDKHLRAEAERIVGEASATARNISATLDVRPEILVGSSAGSLIIASERAALVVVGERGHSGIAGLLLGSTAQHVASHARCPAVIVRGESSAYGPIVLGVDGSPESSAAVAYAFEEASLRSAPLAAVHAWRHPAVREPGDMLPLVYDVEETRQEEERLVAEALAGWRTRYPDVTVTATLVRGGTRAALLDASAGARLLVVGARSGSRWSALSLGSASTAMANRAHCPVAIVAPHPTGTASFRGRAEGPDEG